MIRTNANDQKQRNERLAQVTPELIHQACKHPGVDEMYHSILDHSGYNCAKMYIWISWFGRGRAESKAREGLYSKGSLSGKP